MLLTLVFAFEMVDALCRDLTEPEAPPGSAGYRPRVCLQVPAYNEPPELVRQTLEALARLDYPNYLVQVVVNNTTDPLLWQPVRDACVELGERFQFVHLPRWPGFKAGALNEATRRLDADVEVVAIVDADYLVASDFLTVCTPFLADPEVAFLQTPQHYREWRDSAYLRGLFHSYRYFFEVTMVSRAVRSAVLTVAMRFETTGYMVFRRVIPLAMVDDLYGGVIRVAWNRLGPWIQLHRERTGNQKAFEWFQWLAERLINRAEAPPPPAYVQHRGWTAGH